MKIRRIIAVFMAKAICKLCKKLGRQGVTWAGKIALIICPSIIKELSDQVREKIFVVCGTNGKTTTNNLICAGLEAEKKKVICNHTGSNMLNGVASAFVLYADWKGNIDADYACIEVDELSTKQVFKHFKPDFMVLTNLFRDQLDRYGEIDITISILENAISLAPKMKLIINADDVLSVYLAQQKDNEIITYGVKERFFDNDNSHEIRESKFCKVCGAELNYNFYHYSQLGDYYCRECGFKRPDISYNAEDIVCDNKISFKVGDRTLSIGYKGFYNVYNILASFTAIKSTGLNADNFQDMLDTFNPENGRMEEFKINGTTVTLNLAKNPAGFNQNISAVMQDGTKKDIIVVINDNDQDGIDVSWLWDVDFERFEDESICSILTSGIRGRDMLLRFKYEGIKAEFVPSVRDAIQKKTVDGCKNLYVLVNYTALYSTRNILSGLEEKENGE